MPHTLRPLDPDTQYAALQERVTDWPAIQPFRTDDDALLPAGRDRTRHLVRRARAGGKTQWQTIVTSVGVLVAILGSLGALAYLPIRNGMDQLSAETRLLRDTTVPRAEHFERWRRFDDDIKGLDAAINRNADRIVPRGEHEEKWRSNERLVSELQRQVDELRRAQLDRPARR
jgi:hypothetical protein